MRTVRRVNQAERPRTSTGRERHVVQAILSGVLSAAISIASVYTFIVRRWHLRWGATRHEVQLHLPGDEQLSHPRIQSTRAITIRVPPERVWPWLVQLGQGRGGFYSYTWLENLFGAQIHNAERIEASLQHLREGDFIRIAPERFGPDAGFHVIRVEPKRALVLRAGPPDAPAFTWAFVLDTEHEHWTRLIVRCRYAYFLTLANILMWRVLTEPAHFIMERRMLLGIRERAEREVQDRTTSLPSHRGRPAVPVKLQPPKDAEDYSQEAMVP